MKLRLVESGLRHASVGRFFEPRATATVVSFMMEGLEGRQCVPPDPLD